MTATHSRPVDTTAGATTHSHRSGADLAFLLLRTTFTVAPIVFGLDKFLGILTDWDKYLAPWIDTIVPGTTHQAMMAVGVVEIIAGIAVAVLPRYGAFVVAAWLVGIIVDLVTWGGFYDVALRDFGLFAAAVALGLLAWDRPMAKRHAKESV